MSEVQVHTVAGKLRSEIEEKGFVDIGIGAADHFAVTPSELTSAVALLQEEEGFKLQKYRVQKLGTDNFVTITVLQGSDPKYKAVFDEFNKIEGDK
ncbi:helix-turn-helix DNA-binding domain protein [Arthrobacter phage Qui]|uniref:Helix-turn-helix DNA binding domain protein n=1 Tax=Arthrobacter phage Qui TaxID=2603260 RepID=A0A5B8WIH5_9CAUD|nr:helix-turn-helix DNA-binding domain protein [Arthrobacter phage Qui]QED11577.1 helix-turn-helix DNA-binding domain protein [Arthrobacter phage Qui]QOC56409.1 helix-turn-helix DNA-binding domain protein [Arthrobacter phage Paella]